MVIPNFLPWQPDHMRFTAFVGGALSGKDRGWWHALTSTEPEVSTSKPHTAEFSEAGEFAGNRLELRTTINRVDWIFTKKDAAGQPVPLLDDVASAMSAFSGPFDEWLAKLEPAPIRLAFGTALITPEETRRASYDRIQQILPQVDLRAAAIQDVLINLNLPEDSKIVSDQVVNRLVKGACMLVKMYPVAGAQMSDGQENMYTRIELDFNSSATSVAPLDVKSRVALFDELLASAATVMTKGLV